MVELETREQAQEYLAQIHPNVPYAIHPFESGWVAKQIIPPEENLTRGLGLANLIIDKETGIVTVHPSLATSMVAEQYAEAKRTGKPLPGRQIYPYQWSISLRRIQENDQTIVYQMTAESLTDPPEPTQHHLLTINKQTLQVQPTDPLSRRARARAEAVSRQNQGVWPEATSTRV